MVQDYIDGSLARQEEQYHTGTAAEQKEMILQRMKERGYRITKQRMILLDVILGTECSCCKEIYFKASSLDPKIGTATVYRMINTLEEMGAISRKNMYRICSFPDCDRKDVCGYQGS